MIQRPSPHGLPGSLMRCGIALGANVGERRANLELAARALAEIAHFSEPVLKSPLYETEPVDCAAGTPPFLNAVMEIGFFGTPHDMWDRLRAVETAMGRPLVRDKNAPRMLDLDFLYADRLVVNEPDLELPHPRLTQRRFVLEPLAVICPHLRLPGQTASVQELLAALASDEQPLRKVAEVW